MSKRKLNKPLLSWEEAVLNALVSLKGTVHLSDLNGYVEKRFPYLLKHNHTWQATVRRVVQQLQDKGLAVNDRPGYWRATRSAGASGRTA